LPPVKVNALIEWGGITTEYEQNIAIGKTTNITIHFHKRRLTEDQNLFVREGDFVQYGDILYEITSLSEPRQLFGQINYQVEITAICTRAREGLFDGS